MANPRELAEQAFSILQNALRDSEARASELDEQLKRKKAPKNKLEEQLDVLTHKLETVEAERTRWQQQASHLEEIAEAERVKVAQLKKKLEIAESGPEKLTKKEINFWRGKAEDIDTETKDYKTRLAGLRREIMERDALIEKLRTGQGAAPQAPDAPAQADGTGAAAGAEPAAEPAAQLSRASSADVENLRSQLAQRDSRLTELQVELNELREAQEAATANSGHSLEIQAQIETLHHQVTTIDQALTEAHGARAALKAELAQARSQLDHEQRANREAQAGFERARSALADREQRLTEMSAEVEQLRAELRQREQQMRDNAAQRDANATALAADLEAARRRADQAVTELEQVRGALAQRQRAERAATASTQVLQAAVTERDQRLAEGARELEQQRRGLEQKEQELASVRREAEEKDRELAMARREIEEKEQELASGRRAAEEKDQELAAWRREIEGKDRALGERRAELEQRDRQLEQHQRETANRDRQLADRERQSLELERELRERNQQLHERDEQLRERDRQIAERAAALASYSAELEQARAMLEANDRDLTSLRDTLLGANRELDLQRNHKHRLEAELSDVLTRSDTASSALSQKDEEIRRLVEQQQMLESQRDEIREQMAGLEAELKEEKDNAENLGELANERRESMTKLQEKAEDAEERYEEAKYRLGRAAHFERLVQRRKGLVAKLLAALRAKAKSNVALKAGLDGLRTYKAAAEMNQQKLLQRIETLKQELNEAEETIARHHGATQAKEQLATSESKAASLEQRLNAQAEVIQTLEEDLKVARMAQKSGGDKNHEIERLQKEVERLQKELDTKTGLITQMQNDVDDQQRKLAKLRGSESETVRLRAISEKDRGSIEALEREIATLREALAERASAPAVPATGSGGSPELEAKLKEREQSVTRLMSTIKEHENTIKKLTESADSWKRKYQFLATDSPDAYKTAAEK
jgi:chromosome segregation ATPase